MKNIVLNQRFWLVIGLLLLVECAALWAYRSCSRTLPESQCSEVYRRYAHVEGVEAAFVKGFPINDTLGVDVTLLRAADSAGWAYLMEAFNIPKELLQLVKLRPEFRKSERVVLRDHPEIGAAYEGENPDSGLTADDVEVCAIDYLEREVCVFHTRNAEEVAIILDYNFDDMTTEQKTF